jgi:hypothetical protein
VIGEIRVIIKFYNKKFMQKNHKASVLAVTLITLSIVLITALAVSLAAIKQRNASLGSGKSNTAFQNADTGVEKVMNDIKNNSGRTVGQLPNYSNGKIVSPDGIYTIELKKEDGTLINAPSTRVEEVATIRSVGTGAGQDQRAIEAAVAAAGNATSVITGAAGPLPKSGTFVSNHGGPLLIFVSGSGYNTRDGGGWVGVRVDIDSTTVGETVTRVSTKNTYTTLPSSAMVINNVSAGTHTLKIYNHPDFTNTDGNNLFWVTTLEL